MNHNLGLDLAATNAVITGAGSGIGRAIAQAISARGARVVVSDVNAERAKTVAQEITDGGGTARAMACDVTDLASLEALRDDCVAAYGGVDLVVNNVGVLAMGPPETLPLDAWQRIIDINLLGMVRANLVFLPLLIEQAHGHVVYTASMSGLLAHGYDRLPYVTTKHAVVGMAESLAMYLRPHGVGVTCLCPSGVQTNIVEQITFYGRPSTPRTPDYPIVTADIAGELVADAVRDNRFLVLTAPGVHDEMVERVADIEAYLTKHSSS